VCLLPNFLVVRESHFLRSCVGSDRLPFRERYLNLWLRNCHCISMSIFMPDMAPILHALLWSPSQCHELLNMSRTSVLVSQNSYGGGLYVGLFVTNNSLKTTNFSDVTRKLICKRTDISWPFCRQDGDCTFHQKRSVYFYQRYTSSQPVTSNLGN